jgi:hypothetical protein
MLISTVFTAKVKDVRLHPYKINMLTEGITFVRLPENFIVMVPASSKIIAKHRYNQPIGILPPFSWKSEGYLGDPLKDNCL